MVGHGGAAELLGDDHDKRVVAGDRAEDVGHAGPVEGGGDDVGRARAGCAARRGCRSAPPRPPSRRTPGAGGPPGPPAGWAAPGWRRRSRRPATRTLMAPRSSRSRDTVAWVATHPSAARSSTSWAWFDTAWCSMSLAIRCWRWVLPMRTEWLAITPPGSRPAGRGRRACGWRPAPRSRLRGPSTTAPVTSSPRWAGRQCRKTASGAASAQEGVVDGEPLELPRAASPPRPPGPSTSTRRCRRRRRRRRPRRPDG